MVKHVFRVGDRVRFVEYGARATYGDAGEVVDLAGDGMPYGVRPDNALNAGFIAYFSADELEPEREGIDGRLSDSEALDLIAQTVRVGDLWTQSERLDEVARIVRETGREL